jgi:hypothetical protein
MPLLYDSNDPATKIGEIIGTLMAIVVYAGVIALLGWQMVTG